MAHEQEVTMSASIRTIEGIGKQAIEVFEAAGFTTIWHLKNFNGQDRLLWDVIQNLRVIQKSDMQMPACYWRRLMTRCINIIYRSRSAKADNFVPAEYMCPLTLDWFHNPVVTASGQTYSRDAIDEHLRGSQLDPVTGMNIGGLPLYDNIAMRNAVEHYRLNHQKFTILS
jgi:U-box domain